MFIQGRVDLNPVYLNPVQPIKKELDQLIDKMANLKKIKSIFLYWFLIIF